MSIKKSDLRSESRGERVTVYLDPELASRLRVHCALTRKSLSAAVSAALETALKPETRKRGKS